MSHQTTPQLSVIIPAYNAAATLPTCLDALLAQETNLTYEIIIVDNNSHDNTAEISHAYTHQHPHIHLIHQPKRGAAAARNAGLQIAQGNIVCLTDADCAPTPNWLQQVSAPLRHHPDIAGCKGVYLTHQPELTARFVQIEYEDKYDLLHGRDHIDFIDTYSAAYRRDILLANNGFDENIFYVEDQELSFRLAARGYKMLFQPTAVVYHRHAHTLASYARKKYHIAYWKAQVTRRFPQQAVRDSHTPQIMKIQMALIMLLCATAVPLPFLPRLATAAALLLLMAFLATTIPFVRKAWPKDHTVAFASPALLALRALALSIGYIWGKLNPSRAVDETTAVNTISGTNYLLKRLIDILSGLIGCALTLLLAPLIMLAIRLESPGHPLFKQQRIGRGGHPFTIYKFRSMRRTAEAELATLVDVQTLPEPAFKIHNDPRVTRVGHWLRRWSLDELPQFWNILKGEMSLIGPRPEEAQIVALYNDWHRRRLSVKPGLTGPMQVNGRGDLPLNQRVQLELDYIDNYSLWRDLAIIGRTLPAILRGTGAH